LPSSILSVDSAQKTILGNPTKKTRQSAIYTGYFAFYAEFPHFLPIAGAQAAFSRQMRRIAASLKIRPGLSASRHTTATALR
jgi:hypothetical protein